MASRRHHAPGAQRADGVEVIASAHAFEIERARRGLEEKGGYAVVHRSQGLEVGVYVLVAPEPDRQQPHEDDELYVVLDGRGTLDVEGASFEVAPGSAVFVPAHAEHRFTGYEGLSVLVIFAKGRAGG